MTNLYCESLGIEVPVLERVFGSRSPVDGRPPSLFHLMVVALLERGAPMSLEEIAARMQVAGVGPMGTLLASLKKCRPAREPVFRDGDRYGLDPYSDDLDLMVFVLGLRPPRFKAVEPPPQVFPPRPPPEQALTVAELDEAWRNASLYSWSRQRIVLAVLDAHGAPMRPQDVIAFVADRTRSHTVSETADYFHQRAAAVQVDDEGRWTMTPGRAEIVAMRKAVRDRIDTARRYARPDPAVWEASRRAAEKRRQAKAAELSELRRVIVHGFPVAAPVAVILIDVGEPQVACFAGDEVGSVRNRLAAYEVIAGLDVRARLRGLDFDPGSRRLAELGPPQQSITVDGGGSLKLKPDMLVRGSCGVTQRLAQAESLQRLIRLGRTAKLAAHLEVDARLLYGVYQYGRTHGCVRVLSGHVDAMLPVSWVHRDEESLRDVTRKAHDLDVAVEAVVGATPDLDAPWSRAQTFTTVKWPTQYDVALVDDEGFIVDDRDVQIARLAATIH